MLPLVDPMHLKVTVCVMTVSPVVNSEREAVKSVVLSSSLFSGSEVVHWIEKIVIRNREVVRSSEVNNVLSLIPCHSVWPLYSLSTPQRVLYEKFHYSTNPLGSLCSYLFGFDLLF